MWQGKKAPELAMTEGKGRRLDIGDMHRKTSALAAAADDAGDQFLHYLYGLALRHLEERAGTPPQDGGEDPYPPDKLIQELAEKLRKGSPTRNK